MCVCILSAFAMASSSTGPTGGYEARMASDDGDGGEAGQEGQTQPQKGHGNDSEEDGQCEQEIIRTKRKQTAARAEEALRRLLEGEALARFSSALCWCSTACVCLDLTEFVDLQAHPSSHCPRSRGLGSG